MKRNYKYCKNISNLALTLLLASSIQAAESDFKIADIRVEGLQRVSASPVFAALPIESGDYATPESVQTAIRSLFDTGFFDDIEVFQDGQVLIFKVKERPTITEIKIEGNKAIKTEVLEDAMADNDLAEGQILQRGTLDGILNELERQYVAQGRYSADVKAEIEDLPHNQVKINVVVDEGSVAAIKHINIVGNEVFGDDDLLRLFELNSTGWMSWLTSDDRYAREKLKGDIEKLESFYMDKGYLDFRIVSSQVSLSPDQQSVYITLNIREGEVYKVSKVELAGDLILPEDQLRRMILLREGDTFSQSLMTSTSEYITQLLGNAGYTNAEVKGIPTPNPDERTVELVFLVNPSQRVYVRRVEFKGNTQTQDEVLRREMRQMEGSPASNALIDQGKVRLERLSYFKSVSVENKDVPGTSDEIDVEYTVEEQPFASINANIGYGQYSGFLLGASLQHNNWMGTGKQVGISVNHSEYQTLYNFSYSDPYFTPDGVNRGISLFYRKVDYSKINVTSYSTDSYGLNFSFGYPINEIQRLNFNFGYSHLSVKTGPGTVQEIQRTPFEIDLSQNNIFYTDRENILALPSQFSNNEDGVVTDFSLPVGLVTEDMLIATDPGFVDLYGRDYNTLNLGFTWMRSTLNRGIMATRGSRQTIAFEATTPLSDLEYYTVRYDGQIFQPLYRDFTLRFRTSLAFGDGYGDLDRIPFFKNFYSGGFGSVRGFRKSTLGPKATPPANYLTEALDYLAVDSDGDGLNDSYLPSQTGYIRCISSASEVVSSCRREGELMTSYGQIYSNNRSFGGNLLVEFGADLIFPLPFIDDQRSFQTSLFIDVGNVFDTKCGDTQFNCSDFDASELRASYGIGVNWLSAMGPLTFSLARPISSKDGDDFQEFEFSLAAPF